MVLAFNEMEILFLVAKRKRKKEYFVGGGSFLTIYTRTCTYIVILFALLLNILLIN